MERLQTGQGAARRLLDRLDVSVLGGLSPALANLARGLEADTVSLPDLPSDLVPRWVAPDGRYRLEVFPNERSSDVTDLRRFVSQVHEVAPTATDSPVVVLNSGDVVARAFQQAFACAFVLISVVLWFALRRWQDVMLVLAPLVWASLLTVAGMVVLDIPFNYANVIALPLLLGMGVDSAIHVVARLRGGAGSRDRILSTSTGRAVLVSGLTTFCGLGNLALSPHPGTASMGQVLTVGLLWILVSTLVLLPAVAGSHGHRASPGRSLPLAGP